MSKINVRSFSNENEDGAPDIVGVTTFSATSFFVPTRGTTAQRNALVDGTELSATLLTGSMFYDTTLNKLCVYDNGGWKGVTLGAL